MPGKALRAAIAECMAFSTSELYAKIGNGGRTGRESRALRIVASTRALSAVPAADAHFVSDPHNRLGQFDILNQPRADVQLKKRSKPSVNAKRFLYATGLGELPDRNCFLGKRVDKTSDPSVCANKATLKSEVVDTGEYRQAGRRGYFECLSPAARHQSFPSRQRYWDTQRAAQAYSS